MWYPSTWNEVEALIGDAEETVTLDFKRELTSNSETAKDIGAMTVSGGIIVYGIDEEKNAGAASAITSFPLSGVEEKLRHVAGSLIAPTPHFDVYSIANPDDDRVGVVVVAVPRRRWPRTKSMAATPTDEGRPPTISTSVRLSASTANARNCPALLRRGVLLSSKTSSQPSTTWKWGTARGDCSSWYGLPPVT